MTSAQKLERQFFINLITLVNEVRGYQVLPSQNKKQRKSTWYKQVKNPKQKKDALALV